jgi:hypothetical protein
MRWIVPACPGRFTEEDPKILSSYAATSFKVFEQHFVNGWILVPKTSTPLTKSSNVSITPLIGSFAASSNMAATLAHDLINVLMLALHFGAMLAIL